MANQGNLEGLYVPTTNIWDVGQIEDMDVNSSDFKELLVRLYQNINMISTVLNIKDSAYYDTNEFVNGQQFFPNPSLIGSRSTTPQFRPVFRLVVNFGALPNAGTKTMPHGLTFTSGCTLTRAYAAASDTTGLNYIPIPYASPTLANNIELSVDATNVTIVTGSNRSAFNICYVIVEYLKW